MFKSHFAHFCEKISVTDSYKKVWRSADNSNLFCTFAAKFPVMYEQISGHTLFLMVYAGVTVLNLIACCYLLFRRSNAIAPDVTSSLRLRRWTAAFLGACTLSHLWYMPLIRLTSSEDIMMLYLVCALLDFLTVFPLAIAVLFTMLQDRRRPLWPIGVMVAPIAVGMMVCIATRSDAILPVLYVYYLLLIIGLIIYMVRATQQYGLWLRDNYVDLEHKEVWQSLVVLATILLGFCIYAFELHGSFYKYVAQVNEILLTCFLVWRVETLSDLSVSRPLSPAINEEAAPDEATDDCLSSPAQDKIGLLLQRHCEDTQLYLQHDLNVQQLAKAIGTNRLYLSQYFSNQGTNYNTYINGLRINYFICSYQDAIATSRSFTIKELAYDSGYRSYSTFGSAFKQRMGVSVTKWIDNTER